MLSAGIARTDVTPFWGVELTGWGYYIERRWRTIRDAINATALAVEDGERSAIIVAIDLMVIDARFTKATRRRISMATGVRPEAILLSCSHTHNAPAAGGLLGVGECDPSYEDWASRQAATAAILAWNGREPASLRLGRAEESRLTFNRTRPEGVIDPSVTVARFDRADGTTLGLIVNFGAHPTVSTELQPFAVSRDVPGQVSDVLEEKYPGAIAMYLQGACGDVNFKREYSAAEQAHLPGAQLASTAIRALDLAEEAEDPVVAAVVREVRLPTRRWLEAEIMGDRNEALRRLREDDYSGWREGFGRAMTNRPDDMVKRHGGDETRAVRAMCRFHLEWTEKMLRDYRDRPEHLETETQVIRIGSLCIAANASEFFSPLALNVRERCEERFVMLACYSNGRIGYLPDAHDIAAKSYAGYQSPKYCDQFPFTAESGPVMCDAMVDAIAGCRATR